MIKMTSFDELDVFSLMSGQNLDVTSLKHIRREIRIFMSIAGGDMDLERMSLMKKTYKELRQFCRCKYGIECYIFDPEWGLTQFPVFNSFRRELKKMAYNESRLYSLGPYLLALMGQKYGAQEPAPRISRYEFECVYSALELRGSRSSRDYDLLKDCYRQDKNSFDRDYLLTSHACRTVRERLQKNFRVYSVGGSIKFMECNREGEMEREMEKITERDAMATISGLLRYGVTLGTKQTKFEGADRVEFLKSDFQKELEKFAREEEQTDRCLIVSRTICDLENFSGCEQGSKFAEFTPEGTRDVRHSARLEGLRREFARRGADVAEFQVLWRFPTGVEQTFHAAYLDEVAGTVLKKMKEKISRLLPSPLRQITVHQSEVLHHLQMAANLTERFVGREDVLGECRSYICNSCHRPTSLIIHGEPAAGKATLGSKVFMEAANWTREICDVIRVVRFVGSTHDSSRLLGLLDSIIAQIKMALGGPEVTNVSTRIAEVVETFRRTLDSIPDDRRLVLVLVSMDAVDAEHDARSMRWLPKDPRGNVRVVITVDGTSSVAASLSELRESGTSFLELGPITESEASAILLLNMASYGRTLTSDQLSVVSRNCFHATRLSPLLPLAIASHMIAHESWQSLDDESVSCYDSVDSCFHGLMEKIELLIGSDVTARVVGFLNSSSGLSDCEMEDVLTRDPVVAGRLRGSPETELRFPGAAWMLFRYLSRPLLREQYTHGVVVRKWRHEVFVTLATNRYLLNVEDARSINCALVEHWVSERAEEGAWQVLLDQPIRFDTKDPFDFCPKNPPLYNRRLLVQLPAHLKRAERDTEILSRISFNFEWLFSKAISLSLRQVVGDLGLVPTPEVRILEEAMVDAEPFINDDVTNMAYELTRRLLVFRRSRAGIRSLVDAMDMRSGAFIVAFPVWRVPVCALQAEVKCRDPVVSVCVARTGERELLLCKNPSKEEVEMIDVRGKRHLSSLTTSKGRLYASPGGRWLGVVECRAGTSACINVHDLNTGRYVGHVVPMTEAGHETSSEESRLSHVIVTDSALCYVVSGKRSWLSARRIDGFGSDLDKETVRLELRFRPCFCRLTPDQSMVFTNSGKALIGCPVSKSAASCSSGRSGRSGRGGVLILHLNLAPLCVCFNEESSLAFVALQGNYLSAVDFSLDELSLHNSFDLSPYIKDSVTRDLLHHESGLLLVRSDDYLVVFDACHFCLRFRVKRPEDLLYEFRFPKSPEVAKVKFEDAAFVGDCVAAAVLRDVRIWNQDGCLVAILKAPIGRLLGLFPVAPEVERRDDEPECPPPPWLLATVLENYEKVQVWRADRISGHVNSPDRLPAENVRQIEVGSSGKVIAARAEGGHEVGVFDPVTGHVADLMTHECPVKDFCLSGDGQFLMVSMVAGKKGRVNKVWDVPNRKMLAEFEDAPSVTIAAQTRQYFFCFVEDADHPQKFKIYKTTFRPVKKVDNCRPEVSEGNESCRAKNDGAPPPGTEFCRCSVVEDDVTDVPTLPVGRQWRAIIRDTGARVTGFKQRPFVTCHDGWLVVLVDHYHDVEGFISHRIFAIRLKKPPPCYDVTDHVTNTGKADSDSETEEEEDEEEDGFDPDFGDKGDGVNEGKRKAFDLSEDVVQIFPSDLRKWACWLQAILRLRKHPTEGDLVVVFYTNECDPPGSEADFTCFGFLVVDLRLVHVVAHVENLMPPKSKLDRAVFSRDMGRIYDTRSDVFSLCDASWLGRIDPEFKFCPGRKRPEVEGRDTEDRFGWPMGTLLRDRVMLYLKDDYLTAVRLSDCTILGRITVHTKICSLAIGCDQRTVYAGGQDGSVTSYVVVDRDEEGDKMAEIIANIPSRATTAPSSERVWDARNPFPDYSRPPSMPPPHWKVTEDLNKLNETETGLRRRGLDPPRKSIQVSKTCCLM